MNRAEIIREIEVKRSSISRLNDQLGTLKKRLSRLDDLADGCRLANYRLDDFRADQHQAAQSIKSKFADVRFALQHADTIQELNKGLSAQQAEDGLRLAANRIELDQLQCDDQIRNLKIKVADLEYQVSQLQYLLSVTTE